jgi:glycosyltransferase involved in cell wall biosynthesis
MAVSISVIIPTYRRPRLLEETLDSCLAQTRLPDEILIGDDSPDDETEKLVQEKIIPRSPVPIRYFHHKIPLKEAANVDFLYAQAAKKRILHLHDDDPICPNCLEDLARPFAEHPEIVASFGLQHVIAEDGASLPAEERKLNEGFFRVPQREGIVDPFFAGTVSMFPNNGFLVDADTARKIGYKHGERAGLAVDFYFGFRLGQQKRPFYFVCKYTAMARMTRQSTSRSNFADNAFCTFKILWEDLAPEQITPEIGKSLSNRVRGAIMLASRNGNRDLAWKWYFSKYHRRYICTPGGIWRFIHLFV